MKRWLVYDFSQDASCNYGVERPVGEGCLFTTLIGKNSGVPRKYSRKQFNKVENTSLAFMRVCGVVICNGKVVNSNSTGKDDLEIRSKSQPCLGSFSLVLFWVFSFTAILHLYGCKFTVLYRMFNCQINWL